MDDNSTMNEQLHRYFDGELEGAEKLAFEAQLAASPELQRSLEALSLSKYAVNRMGLQQQVSAIHNEYKANKNVTVPVRKMKWVRYAWGAAAAAVIVIALFILLPAPGKNMNAQNLYASVYKPYDNTQLRSGTPAQMEKAYQSGDFKQVITTYQALPGAGAKEKLLAACAYMETGEAEAAKNLLLSLQQENRARKTTEFADDAEYYLALCYLKLGNLHEAGILFQKINGDPAHLYSDKIDNKFMQRFNRLSNK